MIGQTMINVKASGARTRISTFLAGVFLLILVVALGGVVSVIPMAALVAVMIFVSWATFDWHSIHPRTLKMMPKSETMVMVATVIVVVATHNLAIGVGVGVLVAMVLFARRVAHFVTVKRSVKVINGQETASYVVDGELFFASSNDLYTQFDYALDPEHIIIDMHASHLWDASTIAALDAITEKYHNHGKNVEIIGLNDASVLMRDRLAGKLSGH
jgi:SulP family sulfate permease